MRTPSIWQRVKEGERYPWKRAVEYHKTGRPKTNPAATSLAMRYQLVGKSRFETFANVADAGLAARKVQAKIFATRNRLHIAETGAKAGKRSQAAN